MEAIIFGSGPTRNLIKEVPDNIFTVSCNLSFPNSRLIFAQDEPIIDKIVKEHIEGFNTQIIFTPLRAYERYADSGRLLLIDEDKQKFARRRTALKRFGNPEEVAHITLSLVLPSASYITGAAVPVDGGMRARNN